MNVSAYLIEIGDIQERVTKCGAVVCAGFTDNVADAESRGIELESILRIADGWTVANNLSWGESKLTEDSLAAVGDPSRSVLPNPALGLKGDRLPNTPEVTGAVSVAYEGDINFAGMDLPMFANVQWWYVGSSFTEFNDNDPVYFKNESYTETRLRAGLQGDRLGVTFYVNNLFDQTNDLGSRSRVFTTIREITTNRPRTIGVTFQVRM